LTRTTRRKENARISGRVDVSRPPTTRAAELESLYVERYADYVRVATAIAGSEARAADAVQETFARALSSIGAFRGEGPLAAWIWRILVNTSRNAARTRDLPSDDIERNGAQPASPASDDELGVRRWVASLPERQRLAVFLRYYGDCDYRAIAEALEVEVGTVSAMLSTAHAALRRMMKEVPS
jgi:RNA polymerase sigma-70 factor (ECF subfamily)